MKKITLLSFVVLILISACGPQAPSEGAIQTAIAQTEAARPTSTFTAMPTNTPLPTSTNTPLPTNTPRLTNTPKPTNTIGPTDTPTAEPIPSQAIAKNYVASQDSGGVILEIARVLVADKNSWTSTDFSQISEFDDKITVVEIIFKIVNNTDKKINLYVDQGKMTVNGEPIDLFEYSLSGADFGDDLGGEFLPGTTAIGGIWVGVKRTQWDQITKIKINVNRPTDDDYNQLGPEFYFDIDIVDWTFEELPNELK